MDLIWFLTGPLWPRADKGDRHEPVRRLGSCPTKGARPRWHWKLSHRDLLPAWKSRRGREASGMPPGVGTGPAVMGSGGGGEAVDLERRSSVHVGPADLSCLHSSQGPRGSRGRPAWSQGRHRFGGPQQSDGICGWGHHGVGVPREGERLKA